MSSSSSSSNSSSTTTTTEAVAPALSESKTEAVTVTVEFPKVTPISPDSFDDADKEGKVEKMMANGESRHIGLYVVTHIPGRLFSSMPDLYTPICVGSAADETPTNLVPPRALTDALRNQDALPHERWSELSSMYRVWKDGPYTRVVGFCHYRCFLNLTASGHRLHGRDVRVSPDEFAKLVPELHDETLLRSVDDIHAIVKRPVRLETTVSRHYAKCHFASDYVTVVALVVKHYPEMRAAMEAQQTQTELYSRNMFVMSWRNFDSFCVFVFDILHRFCKEVAWPRSCRYQSRDVSFLSERLFDAWLRSKQATGCKVTLLPHIFITFPAPGPEHGGRLVAPVAPRACI